MANAIESIIVVISRTLINIAYGICCMFPRRNEVIFVSRQTNEPSYDFCEIGRAFETKGYQVVFLTKKLSKRTAFKYVFHALREIAHLARCRICFVDRYDPVISLIDFKCEHMVSPSNEASGVYRDFPIEPIVVQLWHAFGAFKRFGFQSYDTIEGHSQKTMKLYSIHRNYSWVLCSGEGSRSAFAQAFNCPIERVVPLARPAYDEFKRLRELSSVNVDVAGETTRILFAPTLRKSAESRHPFRELAQGNSWKKLEGVARVEWVFHPLEQKGIASGMVSESLLRASVIVTDYSSIAYEAYLLGKPVVFYTPDIQDYRVSPGLNTDPLAICPQITFQREDELLSFLEDIATGIRLYPYDELEKFVGSSIDTCEDSVVGQLVNTACGWIARKEHE